MLPYVDCEQPEDEMCLFIYIYIVCCLNCESTTDI